MWASAPTGCRGDMVRCGQKVNCPAGAREATLGCRPLRVCRGHSPMWAVGPYVLSECNKPSCFRRHLQNQKQGGKHSGRANAPPLRRSTRESQEKTRNKEESGWRIIHPIISSISGPRRTNFSGPISMKISIRSTLLWERYRLNVLRWGIMWVTVPAIALSVYPLHQSL